MLGNVLITKCLITLFFDMYVGIFSGDFDFFSVRLHYYERGFRWVTVCDLLHVVFNGV